MLPNLNRFNSDKLKERDEYLKIKTVDENTLLLTKDEAKSVLLDYIHDELNLFADSLAKEELRLIDCRIAIKYDKFAESMYKHIDSKINQITERIIAEALSHRIEEEVKKRVAIRLEKIKNEL